MNRRPTIGITLDVEEQGGEYSPDPWYALRKNYSSAVSGAGGIPLALPHEVAMIEEYVEILDAVLVTGGMFDIDPRHYGANCRLEKKVLKPERTEFEMALVLQALAQNKPVMGICGGMQLLAVLHGAELIQHIPSEVDGCLEHLQPLPHNVPGHRVEIIENTLLHRIFCGTTELSVNTVHHQAVKEGTEQVMVCARAPDGVVEAIELPKYHFCLGVQWHPEYKLSDGEHRLFKALVSAAAENSRFQTG